MRANRPSFKGVFFDLGGTLYSYRDVRRTLGPLVAAAAGRMGAGTDVKNIGTAYKQAGMDIAHVYAQRSYYMHRDYFADVFKRFAELLSVDYDATTDEWFQRRQRESLLECLTLKDDCQETLGHLKENGFYLSVVSNIDEDMLQPLMAQQDLSRHFDHWTSSEAACSCKPDRRFFEITLEKAALRASEVLFVGDSPEHDIAGASQLGMATVLITDGGGEPPLQTGRGSVAPDYTIQTLKELKSILATT
jgi:HAD superfamily hydrolase (TIGR01509 family)